ncbi:MAG: polymerase III, alpha subunit protein [Candidatus Wolfebacteria bacterium GW2011_GWC1_43_10]|uniref:DNA polymerase III subunit alpha n=2 Tax=Candidatus Wolfeibacteriota TaxID=1752735 RepID=A0A0G1CBE1_9BACT|nr:MAG: polymerase III, alpha subunit protein [Candidatus Wolfebacteria bacterium GW2011_GWC1_43_10]OGM90228.1 MAG: DNA polymerase III subunit alpha [Candidatus Wolfebacteria bacterium GWA1_42_9]
MNFVHLHTHSHYSLLDGLAKIDDLISQAKRLGMTALALTDHGNLYGAVEFYKKAKKEGIKPILGVEAYLAPKSRLEKNPDEKYYHLTLLAKNNQGWKNLIQLVTKANLEGFYYKPRIDKELLRQHSQGLIAFSGCPSGEIPRFLAKGKKEEAREALNFYKEVFGENFYIEIWHQPKIKEMEEVIPLLVELAQKENVPLVATQDIHYIRKDDSFFHDILLAVQTGNRITDDDRLTLKAGEFFMRSPEEMAQGFSPWPQALENTVKIAESCNVEIPLGKTILPHFPIPEGETSFSFLKKLIDQRIKERYQEIAPEIKDRLEYELGVIEKTGFADYFLIVQDFVNWAKERKIVVGPGRGSAAGSLVSYILKITEVDPIKYNLLFERFLNPDRVQMPDIDLDFTDIRRDEVMGYLRQKYGEDHVAHIITFGTMASRASVRDAGRALGFSYGFCDQIAKLIPFNLKLDDALNQIEDFKKMYQENTDARKLVDAARHLEGVARHASVHACGIVISKEPLTEYLPLQFAPQDTNTIITQFEMYTIEDLGLLKIDLLGLKNLTIIEDTIRTVKDIQNITLDISKIPLDDPKTFKTLQAADTTGVFQLESSGVRRYLKELVPTELEDIVAMVSLYRPGPMELIPHYITRKQGKEKVVYLHSKLEPILSRTYGIGIYQEQMMQIARDLAGFTLSEADILRKAIGKKIKELLDQQKEKLTSGMIENGIDKETAEKIWELFPPFARYGFNRSHAVCYALIAYQTAYLKTHFPVEFMTAIFNADIGDVERAAFLVSEAKKMKVKVLPPDINQSYSVFVPEGNNIRFGLSAIKNVGSNIVDAIIEKRQKGGPFERFEDFLSRVTHKDLNKKSLESLIKAGVFDSLNIERSSLLANLDKILSFALGIRKNSNGSQSNLFGSHLNPAKLVLEKVPPPTKEEKLFWEKELLGFYISDHPLKKYEKMFEEKKVHPIGKVIEYIGSGKGTGSVRTGGIIATVKKIISKNQKPIVFAKIEDLSDTLEVVVFSDVLEKNPSIWEEKNIVVVQGKPSLRDNEPKIIVDQVIKLN